MTRSQPIFLMFVLLVLRVLPAGGQEPGKDRHRVLGDIAFSYSYEETLQKAKKSGKPILAYFTFEY